jgi:alpha-glucosidase
VLHAGVDVLAFRRSADGAVVTGVFNFGGRSAPWPAAAPASGRVLAAVNHAAPGTLPPFGALLIEN